MQGESLKPKANTQSPGPKAKGSEESWDSGQKGQGKNREKDILDKNTDSRRYPASV